MDNPSSAGFMELARLQELISNGSPAQLEAGVEAGLQILSDTRVAFADAMALPEVSDWIKQSCQLESQAEHQRIVVGVVGSTGAGKSSVINAVLDEEGLVPTNCMRACTAVITEISHNTSTLEGEKYRAEIHFISKDEWVKELRVMLADMETGQVSLGAGPSISESEAGIAYQKIRSVYPFLRGDEVKNGTFDLDELTEQPSVKVLLGTVEKLASSNPKDFLSRLKRFIDSKEKTAGGTKEPDAMEYWPLIKVVKVFVRSPILKSGLVLVDLPGVHDSNAARSAVSAKYIEQCRGLWVVAPITRAVDDQVVQKLLGDSFKRQLQFDGTYSSITVICSKADDISVTETLKVLPEEAEARQHFAHAELLEEEHDELTKEVDTMKQQDRQLMEETSQYTTKANRLKTAIHCAKGEDELILFSPGTSRKRPSQEVSSRPHKRPQPPQGTESGDTDPTHEEEPVASEAEPRVEHISMETARWRLEETEAQLIASRAASEGLRRRVLSKENDLKGLEAEIKSAKERAKHACIKYRNDYARPTIQGQFAEGIREIELENAADDEDNFDPAFIHRDYIEVAKRLPVFCVSSKAYQKISGRLKKDDPVTGFIRLEQTEIPALQKHALGIADKTRAVTCRRFLDGLSRFLTSLHLQVVKSDQLHKIADDLRQNELQALARAMDELKKEFVSEINQAFKKCRKELELHIFRNLLSAARIAAEVAISTVNSWICHRNHGGMAYTTFRATCIRDGVFKGVKRQIDFNTALTEPMNKQLAKPWEYVFSNFLPASMDSLAEALGNVLQSFRLRMSQRAELMKAPSFALTSRKVKSLERSLEDATASKAMISTGQKEASRLLVQIVSKKMTKAYTSCSEEYGAGCFKRMKTRLTQHVESERNKLFQRAARKTEWALRDTLNSVHLEVAKKVDRIMIEVSKDYKALLAKQSRITALSTREKVQNLLSQVDGRFDMALRSLAESANPGLEEMAAEHIDQGAPTAVIAGHSSFDADVFSEAA